MRIEKGCLVRADASISGSIFGIRIYSIHVGSVVLVLSLLTPLSIIPHIYILSFIQSHIGYIIQPTKSHIDQVEHRL